MLSRYSSNVYIGPTKLIFKKIQNIFLFPVNQYFNYIFVFNSLFWMVGNRSSARQVFSCKVWMFVCTDVVIHFILYHLCVSMITILSNELYLSPVEFCCVKLEWMLFISVLEIDIFILYWLHNRAIVLQRIFILWNWVTVILSLLFASALYAGLFWISFSN